MHRDMAHGLMADLETRIRRLEDRAALDDLVLRYFLAADGDDMAGVAACFTADATFDGSGVRCAETAAGIATFIEGARAAMGLTIHTPNYVMVRIDDDDHATGLVGAHLELVIGGVALFGAVRYEDAYVREAGAWRIHRRDMRTIQIAPLAEMAEAFASDTPVRWPGAAPVPSDYPRRSNAVALGPGNND